MLHLRLAFAHCTAVALLLGTVATEARAGGPRFVAGGSFFNAGMVGQPVHWASGQLNYYVDQGPLSTSVTNQQAKAMVDAAAQLWSAVSTAGVVLTDKGALNEDVSGANITVGGSGFTVTNQQINQTGVITEPADVTPSATSYPLGVIFDADGSVIDAIYGTGSSAPTSCQNNGVFFWFDNINPNATFAHAVMILNGRCATNASLLQMMSFEVERAFGQILGLDFSQVNPGAASNSYAQLGWPVMQPLSGSCGQNGGTCIPNPTQLHWDDIAALNRLYPITTANLASFPGKQITAANTVSIQGTISFQTGEGMQGVNVVAMPLDANGNPMSQYTVSFVSGSYFNGNHGNPVTGFNDENGNPLTMWGSNEASQQGFFDLSGIPLPPGVMTANYEVTFEAVNPDYIQGSSVGPYLDGSPEPSGTLTPITVSSMASGSAQTLTVTAESSSTGGFDDAIGTQAQPRILVASGQWSGRLSQVGQTDWFNFPVRGNRIFTVVTEALDETGAPTNFKAMPALGIWDAFDPVGTTAVGYGGGLNGLATGESWLQVATAGDDVVRLGIADERGDGRPDYIYQGWVLYADAVTPQRLPTKGGPIVIHGMGFRMADTVKVGGQQAVITSISPNEITAIAPAAATGITGSVDVEVDDLPTYTALTVISDGISYDSGNGDALTLNTAPMGTVPTGVPIPFTVTALGPDLTPASGISVTFAVTSGTATLGCGQTTCTVSATGDGHATLNITATSGTWSNVTATLTNGSSVRAEFIGGAPPVIKSLTPMLSLAAGSTATWTTQALALTNGLPASGQTVVWQSSSSAITMQGGSVTTNTNGIAAEALTVGPLTEGQTATATACINGTGNCATYTAFGARPEYATLVAVSGTSQSLSVSGTANQIVLRVLDMDGNPMTSAVVTLYESIYAWTPPCPRHGRCDQPMLLASQSAVAVSALDGTVSFSPASLPSAATNMIGLAVTGNSASVSLDIEQHP